MKTVRVRIAVAVDKTGHWSAVGWKDAKDAMGHAVETLEPGEARYWLEADLPIPTESTVEARVTVDE